MINKIKSFFGRLKDFWDFLNHLPTDYLKKLPVHSFLLILALTFSFNFCPFIIYGSATVYLAVGLIAIWFILSPFRFSWRYYNNTIEFLEPHELTIKCDEIKHYTFNLKIGRRKLQNIIESGKYTIQIKKPTFIRIHPKDLLPEQVWNSGESECSLACNYNMETENLFFVFKVSTSISTSTNNNKLSIHFILNEIEELLHEEPLNIDASECVS